MQTKFATELWSDRTLIERWVREERYEAEVDFGREKSLAERDRGHLYASGEHCEIRLVSGTGGRGEIPWEQDDVLETFTKQF